MDEAGSRPTRRDVGPPDSCRSLIQYTFPNRANRSKALRWVMEWVLLHARRRFVARLLSHSDPGMCASSQLLGQ